MSIPTCAVKATILDSVGGLPISGAVVKAKLSSFEFHDGVVVPREVMVETDVSGVAILNLWPNSLGVSESYYNITVVGNGKTFRTTAVVPSETTVNLEDIAEVPPYEGKTDGYIILSQIFTARNAAMEAAAAAMPAAVSASVNAENTALDRIVTGQDRAAASLAATTAIRAAEEVVAAAETVPTRAQFADIQTQVNALGGDPGDAVTQIFFPAVALQLLQGAGVSFGSVAARLNGWTFPTGIDGRVGMVFAAPSHWESMFIDMHFVNTVANAGNLSIQGGVLAWADGDQVNVAPTSSSATVAADATPFRAFTRTHSSALAVNPAKRTTIQVVRNALPAGSDTLPNSVILLGVTLRKAS